MPEYVSVPRAGQLIGRSPRTVQRLIADGHLKASSVPGYHTKVLLASVQAYIPAKAALTMAISRVVDSVQPTPTA